MHMLVIVVIVACCMLHVHPLIVVNAHGSNSSNCTLHAIRHPVEYCLVVNVEYVFMLFRYVT